MQNFIKVSFIRVRCTLMKNMALKLVNFYKDNMPEGERAMLKHFSVKSSLGVIYFHAFGNDSYETYTR